MLGYRKALLTANLGQRHNLVLQVAAIRLRPAKFLGLLERLVVQRLVRTLCVIVSGVLCDAVYHNILDFSARVLATMDVEIPKGLKSTISSNVRDHEISADLSILVPAERPVFRRALILAPPRIKRNSATHCGSITSGDGKTENGS